MPRPRRHRSAAVLLLSLLIMAGITAATIAIAVLITSDFEQTRTTADFVQASEAADTGIERSLAVIGAGRAQNTVTDTVAAIGNALTVAPRTSATIIGDYGSATPTTVDLLPGQTTSFDILKNAAGQLPEQLVVTTRVNLRVEWTVISNSGSAGQGRANPDTCAAACEINLLNVYIEEAGNLPGPFTGSNALGYRIRLINTSTTNDIRGLGLTAKTGATTFNLFSTIIVTSTGTVGDVAAEKQVTTLWQRPSSGIFSFVLFTEGDIIPAI